MALTEYRPGSDAVVDTSRDRGAEVSEELRKEVESAFRPTSPNLRSHESPTSNPLSIQKKPITRTAYDALSPQGQSVVNTQRAVLNEMGARITGHREVLSAGSPTELTIYVAGDRRDAFIGARLHKGQTGNIETAWTVPVVGSTGHKPPQR